MQSQCSVVTAGIGVLLCMQCCSVTIDTKYNKRLDCQQPCLEDELNGGSNNIVQSNKSVDAGDKLYLYRTTLFSYHFKSCVSDVCFDS